MNRFQRVQQATWSSPVSNRFLLEAGFGTYLARYGSNELPGNPTRDMVRLTEQCAAGCAANGGIPNLAFRSHNWEDNWNGAHTWRGSASYVTGAHHMKFGYQGAFHSYNPKTFTNNQFLQYRVNNGVPNQITQTLMPFDRHDRVRYTALYAQEQWTRGRMTLQGAVRYDNAWSYFLEQRLGPTRFAPVGIVYPQTEGVTGFHDLTPRVGVAYDLFGNGKTSVKINAGRYLEAAAALGIYSASNPVTRVSTSATRTWTDSNSNWVADCDLLNPAAQNLTAAGGDNCAALSDQNFGRPTTFSNSIDPAVLGGWGVRSGDWGIGASIQQELLPRVSAEIGYFRRWLVNFNVNDNRRVTAAQFDRFSITAPADPRLPDGGGYVAVESVQRHADTVRPDGQSTHRRGELRRAVSGLQRRPAECHRAAAERADGAGRAQRRQDRHGQLRRSRGPSRTRSGQPVLSQRSGHHHPAERIGGVHHPAHRCVGERHVPQRSRAAAIGQLRRAGLGADRGPGAPTRRRSPEHRHEPGGAR